jgi:hypothetical protein
LLNVPIPPVYTAELQDQREIVIDGQQRLVSFFSFIDEKFPKGEEFKLRGLQVLRELNSKSFKDLEKSVQRAFENYGLPMIIITKDSDEEVNDPTCLICQQKIQTIDDAEIDHVEHYWRGGETISSNARLTHRFCNRSRGGGDAASFH